MSENTLLLHCSPTVAGIKTANLFTCTYRTPAALRRELRQFNRRLAGKGLRLMILRFHRKRALIYLFRPAALQRDLEKPEVQRILKDRGYGSLDMGACLEELVRRLRCEEAFPHEIGLFLGYPAGDVEGFIRSGGRDCLYAGPWKVYGDVDGAKTLFEKYRRCTEVYCRLNRGGMSLEQLAVAI